MNTQFSALDNNKLNAVSGGYFWLTKMEAF